MQNIFTIIAEIERGHVDQLRTYLESLQPGKPNEFDLPLVTLPSVHYASLLIVPQTSSSFAEYLVFENNIDGTTSSYIDQLCSVAFTALDTIFSHCTDYVERDPSKSSTSHLREYLRKHVLYPNASFVGNVGRTVTRIKNEKSLVDEIEKLIDMQRRTLPDSAPQNIYDALRSAVSRGSAWALAPKRNLSSRELLRRRLDLVALFIRLVIILFVGPATAILLVWRISKTTPPVPLMLALLAAPTVVILTVLRIHETRDVPDTSSLRPANLLALTENEDQGQGQNHFASLNLVKAGLFRRTLLRVVLCVIDRLAAGVYINGTLGNLDNIHYAQWVLLDSGRRLLFLTNYDGTWENYLDDFIDRAASGLTAIWSNTIGFPKTSWLIKGGARDERQFKTSARRSQITATLWYTAYQGLTVTSIQNNTEIRNGLATPPQRSAVDSWLRRL